MHLVEAISVAITPPALTQPWKVVHSTLLEVSEPVPSLMMGKPTLTADKPPELGSAVDTVSIDNPSDSNDSMKFNSSDLSYDIAPAPNTSAIASNLLLPPAPKNVESLLAFNLTTPIN